MTLSKIQVLDRLRWVEQCLSWKSQMLHLMQVYTRKHHHKWFPSDQLDREVPGIMQSGHGGQAPRHVSDTTSAITSKPLHVAHYFSFRTFCLLVQRNNSKTLFLPIRSSTSLPRIKYLTSQGRKELYGSLPPTLWLFLFRPPRNFALYTDEVYNIPNFCCITI